MVVSSWTRTCTNNVVHLSGRIQGQMGAYICGVTSGGPSSSYCFQLCSGKSKRDYPGLSVTRTISCSSTGNLQTFQENCLVPPFSKPRCNLRSLTIKCFISARGFQKRQLELSLACQSINIRLWVPKQGVIHKIKCNAGPINWPQVCASVGLIFGLLVCYSSSKPVHAEAADEKENNEDRNLSYVKCSHGKKVYTDYSVIGEQLATCFQFFMH